MDSRSYLWRESLPRRMPQHVFTSPSRGIATLGSLDNRSSSAHPGGAWRESNPRTLIFSQMSYLLDDSPIVVHPAGLEPGNLALIRRPLYR